MRSCDNCKKPLHLGQDEVRVTFIGTEITKKAMQLIGTDQLDFCCVECFAEYLIKVKEGDKCEG